ncbi:TPA: DNA repair and recombination protein RadA [archaeon]|jgi:DNA repair protein RadA|uniref:DNA repair and recombination protein RadA n=1 Tax=Candidatus Undinarchaeum marinum TaxID=2756141 RepID=A0A832UTF1_9ARCH|nr:DNA repair and recombination protein RadA [Candidatus Undinarchaeum marinum]
MAEEKIEETEEEALDEKEESSAEEAPVEEAEESEEATEEDSDEDDEIDNDAEEDAGEGSLEDLEGIGPATAKKLMDGGYSTIKSVATAAIGDITEAAEISEAKAKKVITLAKEKCNMGFESADRLLIKRQDIGKLTTGSETFDTLLAGGMETQAITECYGEWGSGKSQVAMQLAVTVQLPVDKGGLDGEALFIDTENTFRPERIVQMAKGMGLDPDEALKKIHVARAYTSDDQMLMTEKAAEMVRDSNVRIVIVDSLTSLFRSEYVGRGTLAARQQKLNRHLSTLHKLADLNNCVVYVTNQVMSKPDMFFGDPTKPIGGHILGHSATFRIYLRKSKAGKRIARLVDSPNLPDGEAVFKVTENGLED